MRKVSIKLAVSSTGMRCLGEVLFSIAFVRQSYAGFRLTCRLPHCRFDDDICTTAQASLAAEGWPSGKQRQANRSITLPLCPPPRSTVVGSRKSLSPRIMSSNDDFYMNRRSDKFSITYPKSAEIHFGEKYLSLFKKAYFVGKIPRKFKRRIGSLFDPVLTL